MEQYYHAPGKLSTMVLEVGARALTKHALNVHCGHDDFYAALDTGWTMLMAKDAQQAADQAHHPAQGQRAVAQSRHEHPGRHAHHAFASACISRPRPSCCASFSARADDMIDCPTPAQRELFGPKRRRVPEMMDLKNPILLGPVQNQEHHMNGVVARRNNFNEPILPIPRTGLCGVRPPDRPPLRVDHRIQDARMRTRCSSRSAARRRTSRRRAITCANSATRRSARFTSTSSVRSRRPRSSTRCAARRTSSSSSAPTKAWPATIRSRATSASRSARRTKRAKFGGELPALTPGGDAAPVPRRLRHRLARLPSGAHARRLRVRHRPDPAQGRQGRGGRRDLFRARRRSSVCGDQQGHAVAAAGQGASPCGSIPSAAGA